MASPHSDDPTLPLPTWSHYAWSAIGCITVLISLASKPILHTSSHPWLQLIPSALLAYLSIDLVSGIYHWTIDNYGSAKTPIFGLHIESFTNHHKTPFSITRLHMATNLNYPAQVITFTLLPLTLVCSNPVVLWFFGVFGGFFLLSVQIHSWAHCSKGSLPVVVAALQDVGVILTRSHHARHHVPPYNSNYCAVSGLCNKFLDESKVFVAMEIIVFVLVGVRPRSWTDQSNSE